MKNFVIDYIDGNEMMLVSIIWIGHVLDPNNKYHMEIIEEKCKPKPSEEQDYLPQFELNTFGEAICLNEYATNIAKESSINVLHIDISHSDADLKSNHVQEMHEDENLFKENRQGR